MHADAPNVNITLQKTPTPNVVAPPPKPPPAVDPNVGEDPAPKAGAGLPKPPCVIYGAASKCVTHSTTSMRRAL